MSDIVGVRRRPSVRLFLAFAISALALLNACAAVGRQSGAQAQTPRTVLEVDNRGFADMTVYAIDGGQRVRLGFAPGNTKTELTIPRSMLSGPRQLQFLCDPIGGSRNAVSDQIYVEPGDQVVLIIPASN